MQPSQFTGSNGISSTSFKSSSGAYCCRHHLRLLRVSLWWLLPAAMLLLHCCRAAMEEHQQQNNQLYNSQEVNGTPVQRQQQDRLAALAVGQQQYVYKGPPGRNVLASERTLQAAGVL
jgi:hypothetical protein